MLPFYTPLKSPDTQRISDVSRGYKMVTLARNELNKLIAGLKVCWVGPTNTIVTDFPICNEK